MSQGSQPVETLRRHESRVKTKEISDRLAAIFRREEKGRRPVFGGAEKFQVNPHWRDNRLCYEYVHGGNGAGLGASHQTGWTGHVARTFKMFGRVDPKV